MLAETRARRLGAVGLALVLAALFGAHPAIASRREIHQALMVVLLLGASAVALIRAVAARRHPPVASGPGDPSPGRPARYRYLIFGVLALCALFWLWSHLADPDVAWELLWWPLSAAACLRVGLWLAADGAVVSGLGTGVVSMGALAGAYAVCQHAGLDPLPTGTPFVDRVVSVFDNPNHLGSAMALVLPLSLAHFATRQQTGSIGVWLHSIVGAVYAGLLLSGSRGAWWACLGGCVTVAIGFGRYWKLGRATVNWRPILSLAALLAVITFALSGRRVMVGSEGPVTLGQRIGDSANIMGPAADLDSTVNHRLFLWRVAADMIRQRPWSGFGLGGYGRHYAHFRDQLVDEPRFARLDANQRRQVPTHVHNEYLQLWSEGGVFALAGFCCIVGFGLLRGLAQGWSGDTRELRTWAVSAALISVLIHALVSYPLHMPITSFLFWILLGMTFYSEGARARSRYDAY